MWPALLAAAVAASTGLLAKKHLFKPAPEITVSDPRNDAVSSAKPPQLPWESDCEDQVKEGIFRFASDGSAGGSGKKKKTRLRLRKKKDAERSEGAAEQKKSGRRVGVCLKKRKTGKNGGAKCGSSSNSKG